MGAQPSTIVPANRLGQLLAEARLRNGADLDELAERSDGRFTVGELSDVEAGHRLLDDRLITVVTSLYEVDCGPIIPQRAELTIDLDRNLVSAAGRVLPLDSGERDHIIDRYLSLVYVLRNRRPGTTVPLRDEDVAILAASLAERSELIEEQLLLVMETAGEPVNRLVRWFKTRMWVPGTGVLVGAVSVGTLVMVASDAPRLPSDVELPDDADASLRRIVGVASLPLADSPTSTAAASTPPPTTSSAPDTSAASTAVASSVATSSSSVTAPPSSTTSTSTSSSAAPTTTAAPTPAEVGAAAEALMPFDWRTGLSGWTIDYRPSNPGYRGLTFPYEKRIEMYVRASDTPRSLAGILAHELGHAIDVTHFSNGDRERWQDARNIGDSPWWPSAYASDFETGAGDFAEAFAYWAVRDGNSSKIAGVPDSGQLQLISELVNPHF